MITGAIVFLLSCKREIALSWSYFITCFGNVPTFDQRPAQQRISVVLPLLQRASSREQLYVRGWLLYVEIYKSFLCL